MSLVGETYDIGPYDPSIDVVATASEVINSVDVPPGLEASAPHDVIVMQEQVLICVPGGMAECIIRVGLVLLPAS
jgi:hypothetical protein